MLLHECKSTAAEGGLQALVFFDARPSVPSHLGLETFSDYSRRVFLQSVGPMQSFGTFKECSLERRIEITVKDYLILLRFAKNDWTRVYSRLSYDLANMKENYDGVQVTRHLSFFHRGTSGFTAKISKGLTFYAKADGRTGSDTDISTWLIKEPPSSSSPVADGGSPSAQNAHPSLAKSRKFVLEMNALCVLAADNEGVETLFGLWNEVLRREKDAVSRSKKKSRREGEGSKTPATTSACDKSSKKR